MQRFLLLLILVPPAAIAQIDRPHLGLMLDGDSTLRPTYGIAASATLGDPVASGVTGFACSAARCTARTDHLFLTWITPGHPGAVESTGAPENDALIAPDAAGAFVYFPQSGQAARWNPRQWTDDENRPPLQFFDFSPFGEVLAIRSSRDERGRSNGFDYAVRRGDGIWMERFSTVDGSVTSLGPVDPGTISSDAVSGGAVSSAANDTAHAIRAVLLLQNGYMAASGDGVAVVHSNGTAKSFTIPGITALYAMSEEYVEAVTENGNWVLCVAAWNESASLLPGVSQ